MYLDPAGGTKAAVPRRSFGLLKGLSVSTAILFCLWLNPSAQAEDLVGHVLHADGYPLADVPICLRPINAASGCLFQTTTDANGGFWFTQLDTGRKYLIKVAAAGDDADGLASSYQQYSWSPAQQIVATGKSRKAGRARPFVGTFSFSNFRNPIALDALDFPELLNFDLREPVFLKVSYQRPDAPPETVYLGRVFDLTLLSLRISMPLSVTALDYEVFSSRQQLRGRIGINEE